MQHTRLDILCIVVPSLESPFDLFDEETPDAAWLGAVDRRLSAIVRMTRLGAMKMRELGRGGVIVIVTDAGDGSPLETATTAALLGFVSSFTAGSGYPVTANLCAQKNHSLPLEAPARHPRSSAQLDLASFTVYEAGRAAAHLYAFEAVTKLLARSGDQWQDAVAGVRTSDGVHRRRCANAGDAVSGELGRIYS